MRRRRIWFVIAGVAVVVVIGSVVAWMGLGPDLVKACPAPALRPVGAGWQLTGSEVGQLNGPGDVRGSRVTWERAETASAPRRRMDVVLARAIDGEWGTPTTVRDRPGRITDAAWPEPGSIAIWWDAGGLGCTIYGATLSGEGVTEAETLQAVDSLR